MAQRLIVKNLKNIDPNLFTEALGKRSKVTKSIQELKPIESKKAKAIKNKILELAGTITDQCAVDLPSKKDISIKMVVYEYLI